MRRQTIREVRSSLREDRPGTPSPVGDGRSFVPVVVLDLKKQRGDGSDGVGRTRRRSSPRTTGLPPQESPVPPTRTETDTRSHGATIHGPIHRFTLSLRIYDCSESNVSPCHRPVDR